jgi:PAS domain S-box-containing protein
MKSTESHPRCGLGGHYAAVLLVASAGLFITAIVVAQLRTFEHRSMNTAFLYQADQRASACIAAIEDRFSVLDSLHAFYASSDSVMRDEFHCFVERSVLRCKGVKAVYWVPRVPAETRYEHEQQARRDGIERYQIVKPGQDSAHESGPITSFPIYYAEPFSENLPILGLDLGCDPVWHDLLDQAVAGAGTMVATEVHVPGGNPDTPAFNVIQPIYRNGSLTLTEASRRENLQGFVIGILDLGVITESALAPLTPAGIDVDLLDVTAAKPRCLYHHGTRRQSSPPSDIGAQAHRNSLAWEQPLDLGEQRWVIRCSAAPEFWGAGYSLVSLGSLVIGLIATSLAASYVRGHQMRYERIQRLVAEKTHDLEGSRAELKSRNEFLHHMLASLVYPLYVIDANDFTVRLSNQPTDDSDRPTESPTCHKLIYGRDRPCDGLTHACSIVEIRNTKKPTVIERQGSKREGRDRIFEVHSYPVLDAEGNVSEVIEYHLDITERKRVEQIQQEYTEELAAIYENAPVIMVLLDAQRRVHKINRAGVEFIGAPVEEITGLRGGEALHCLNSLKDPAGCGFGSACRDCTVRRTVTDTLETGRSHGLLEASLPFAIDGRREELTLLLSTSRIHVQEQPMVLVSILDITARKRAETQLKGQLAFIETLLDTIPNPVFYKNTEGRYLGCNSAFESLHGMTASQIVGKTVFEMGPEQIARRYHEQDQDLFQHPGKQHYECQVRSAQGELRYVMFDKATFTNAAGQVGGLIGIMSDTTERKRAEEEIRAQKDLLSDILTNIPAFVFWKDRHSTYLGCNETFARSAGVDCPENIVGKTDYDLAWKGDAEAYRHDDKQVMDSGEPRLAFEETQTTDEGGRISLLTSKIPLRGASGEVVGILGVYVDITERQLAEERQATLLKELESINCELKDFAHIVSHDLKAPLRAIRTLAEWMTTDLGDRLGEEGKEQMRLLLGRADRMQNLINGVLEYSRIGRVHEEHVSIDLNGLVAQVVEDLSPPACISFDINAGLPAVSGEPTRIRQLFQNLLSNAIKYMDKEHGLIRVGCTEEPDAWRFFVGDNGPGIEEKYFDRIFQIFQTLAPRDETESTGVGLTVVKKIVECHGGRIWVESRVGEGATFLFTLPKAALGVRNADDKALAAC